MAERQKGRKARGLKARLSASSRSRRIKALHVLSDLRRDPNLSFTQAAKNREISTRSVRREIRSQLRQERPGGRIRVTASDRIRETMQIPSTRSDVLIAIHTKGSKERYLVGEWIAAIKEAGRGDFARLKRFPRETFIDGVRLPTGRYEVQKILEALETSETPFERVYSLAGAV